MKHLIFFLLCALALGASLAQTNLERPILRVNGQVVTAQDLELVKSMLPLEKLKTSKGKSKLIDGIYTQFLIQKTLLEQAGMKQISIAEIEKAATNLPKNQKIPDGYTKEGFVAKQLLERAFAYFGLLKIGEELANTAGIGNTGRIPKEALREQLISRWQAQKPSWGSVRGRAMLLDSSVQATQLEQQLAKGADFAKLAQRFSLVRAVVGGSLSGTQQPEGISLERLEPELQVGIAQNLSQKRFRVPAVFGRVWLVQLLEVRQNTNTLDQLLTGEQYSAAELSEIIGFSTDRINIGNNSPFDDLTNTIERTITILETQQTIFDPVVVQVGTQQRGLANLLASSMWTNFPEELPELERQLPKYLEQWLTAEATLQGVPYNGAGTEQGLPNYLAARVKVSETQLKTFYNTQKNKYQIGESFDNAAVPCFFESPLYAAEWQRMFTIVPVMNWANDVTFPALYCDFEGESDPIRYSEKPSKQSLRPIVGGFMTNVFSVEKQFAFLLLQGYLPKPLQKPYVLVRGQLEREYRLLVAKKRLPEFERELRIRTGAKNLLEQVLKDLEQP